MGSLWDFGVREELVQVERKIKESIKSDEPLLSEIASYVIEGGGKRLRPTVTLLSFKAAGGKEIDKAIDIATAFELIHSATLIHDDINDGGDMRRGRLAAYKKYGIQNALVTGDFLYVKGFAIGGKFPAPIVDLTASVCAGLAEGEISQKKRVGDVNLSEEDYLDIIRRKTAMPIAASAQVGAILADATPDVVSSMADYGYSLGMAFQIVDDVLDVVGDMDTLGKPIGTDVRESNVTLLTIFALNNGSAVNRRELIKILRRKRKEEEHIRKATKIICESGAVERALQEAGAFIQKAKEALKVLPADNAYRKELSRLADFVLKRDR